MEERTTTIRYFLVILSILVFGCAHVNYVGKSFDPTNQVDIFYSKEEITTEYNVIGHAIGGGQLFISTDKIKRKLIQEAKSQGADAILISGIDRDNSTDGEGFDAEKQIKASFLKYKEIN